MIGENIKYYRKKIGMTQLELAKLLNVSRSLIALYEKEIRYPNEEIIDSLCKIFDVSYDELVYADVENINTKIPLKFRRLKQKDVVKLSINGLQKIYIVNKLHEEYIELFSLSGRDIYYSNVYYTSIDYLEYQKNITKNISELLCINFEELYFKLHLDSDIYRLDLSLSESTCYIGSFLDGKIKINDKLICPSLYKIFYEEGYIKSNDTTAYTWNGKMVNLLDLNEPKIDILLDSDEELYYIPDEKYSHLGYKIAKTLDDNKYLLYTYSEEEGLILKIDELINCKKLKLISRSFKENEDKIDLNSII